MRPIAAATQLQPNGGGSRDAGPIANRLTNREEPTRVCPGEPALAFAIDVSQNAAANAPCPFGVVGAGGLDGAAGRLPSIAELGGTFDSSGSY